jgi:hypothetical protein
LQVFKVSHKNIRPLFNLAIINRLFFGNSLEEMCQILTASGFVNARKQFVNAQKQFVNARKQFVNALMGI